MADTIIRIYENETTVILGGPAFVASLIATSAAVEAAAELVQGYAELFLSEVVGYPPETRQFIARTPTLNNYQYSCYNRAIVDMVASGLWAKADVIADLTAPTEAVRLTNICQDQYHLTLVGAPTFTAGLGYTGVANGSKKITTPFNPTTAVNPHYSRNDGSVVVGKTVHVGGAAQSYFGNNGNTSLNGPLTNLFYPYINSAGAVNFENTVKLTGLFGATRRGADGATVVYGYQDGILLNGPAQLGEVASAAVTNSSFTILQDGANNGCLSTHDFVYIGGGLTDGQMRSLSAICSNLRQDLAGQSFELRLGISEDVDTDGPWSITPGFDYLADGRRLYVWAERQETIFQAEIKYRIFSADGQTALSDVVTLVSPAVDYQYSECGVLVVPGTGTVLIQVTHYSDDEVTDTEVLIYRAPNPNGGSLSFAAAYVVPTSIAAPFSSSPPAYLSQSGRIMISVYNSVVGTNTLKWLFSTNDGLTFPLGSEVAFLSGAIEAGDHFNECCVREVPGSTEIVAIVRNGTPGIDEAREGYYISRATADAQAFTAPTRIYTCVNPARPDFAISDDGLFLLIVRALNTDSETFPGTGWMFSSEGGMPGTWSDMVPYFVTDTYSYGQFLYSQTQWDGEGFVSLIGQGNFSLLPGRLIAQRFEVP